MFNYYTRNPYASNVPYGSPDGFTDDDYLYDDAGNMISQEEYDNLYDPMNDY